MKVFNHSYKQPLSNDEIREVIGYQKALAALYKQLEEMTKLKPENRYIDAVILLEMISDTNMQLSMIFEAKQVELTLQSF